MNAKKFNEIQTEVYRILSYGNVKNFMGFANLLKNLEFYEDMLKTPKLLKLEIYKVLFTAELAWLDKKSKEAKELKSYIKIIKGELK